MISRLKAVDGAGFANMNAAASASAKSFRDAAASTGKFEVQQLRLNSATDDYVKKLRAQKASFREIAKSRKVAAAAYKEQLAMENMTLRRNVDSTRNNKGVYDVIIPKDVSSDLDTAAKRLAFMNAELKSGAHQMVNWGKNTQWAGRQLMVGFTMPIAAFGAAAGVMAYQVDKELTRIAKVYDATAQSSAGIEKELAQVRVDGLKTATQAAKEYGSAATDTLEVQAELAATGKQGAELQKSTLEVMRIARLGEIDNNTAIDATIALQSIWRMSNQELTKSFDYMNSIENATSLSTADFAAAIPVAASSVKAFGGDVQELGILLTAMKENGIGAAEGANALKATMQRLGRPSKQIREEWQQLTGTDITQLVDQSDGLIEVFTKINEATEGLDDNSRRKAFAGLFGSYQVSKMMALTKGMGELRDGVGQVSDAYAISNQDAQVWANTAEKEVDRYKKSLSGMWDSAFQSMKIELAELGEPFLKLGTYVVQGVAKILKAFNDMPNLAKYFIAGGVAITAMAGGVLMLVGLFANLTGNMLKGVGGLIQFATKIDLIDKNSKAAQLATDSATAAYLEQEAAVSLLTMQMGKLAAAQAEANDVMMMTSPAFAGVPPGLSTQQAMQHAKEQARIEKEMQAWKKNDSAGREYFVAPAGSNYQDKNGNRRTRISRQEAEGEATNEVYRQNLAIQEKQRKVEAEGVQLLDAQDEAVDKKNKRMTAGLAIGAAEAVSMGLMLGTSNELANSVGQILMVSALVAPAFAAIKPAAAAVGGKLKVVGTAMKNAVTGASLFSGGLAGARAALTAMMGPVGWAITGLTIAGGILYKVWQAGEEREKKALANQRTLNNLAKSYAEEMGTGWKDFERLQYVGIAGIEKSQAEKNFTADRSYYADSEQGKKDISAYDDLKSVADKSLYEQQLFVDAQVHMGMSAERAAILVKAFMLEAGEGAANANLRAEELMNTLYKINSTADWTKIMGDQRTQLSNLYNRDDKRTLLPDFEYDEETARAGAKDVAENIVGTFNQAMSESKSVDSSKQILASFVDNAMVGWNENWDKYIAGNKDRMDELKKFGIESAQDLSDWWQSASDEDRNRMAKGNLGFVTEDFRQSANAAAAITEELYKTYAETNNIEGGVSKVRDLMKSAAIAAATMTYSEAKDNVNEMAAKLEIIKRADAAGIPGFDGTAAEETLRIKINAFNAANGFKQGKTEAEALAYFLNQTEDGAAGTAQQAGRIAGAISGAIGPVRTLAGALKQLGKADLAAAAKASMQDIQSEMADGWRQALEDRQQAAMDNLQETQDAESSALSDRLDGEQAAMDAAWDRKRDGMENYWEARVDAVDNAIKTEQKAEELRQKMFDNEIARINRLADMANTNIDFNVALNQGNLDEAAKIQNSAAAKDAEYVFNREREKGADKSAKRVDGLENRKDALSKQQDAASAAFDKREEAAKSYFDNYRKMEEESLATSQEATRKSLEDEQELRRKSLDKTLKTFQAFIPMNKKQLEDHAAALGLSLDDFGKEILEPMSITWSKWFKNNMTQGIINSAIEAQSSAAWEALGKKAKADILKALGFKDEQEFNKFIHEGLLGDAGTSVADATPRGPRSNDGTNRTPKETRHGGGEIGSGSGSRQGVAKTYRGTHPSEVDVRAQSGEFMVNRDAASKHRGLLERINSGAGIGGYSPGPAGFIGSVMSQALLTGVGQKLKAIKKQKKAASARAGMDGAFGPGGSLGGGGSEIGGGFVQGGGGRHSPANTAALSQGLHPTNALDIAAAKGSPAFAIADGVVTGSYDIPGYEPRRRVYGQNTQDGTRSYGRVITIDHGGFSSLYAHLAKRSVSAGQSVKGGAVIGAVGNAGNVQSTSGDGTHLHFGVSGGSPFDFLSLRKGAQNIKYDNTMANLHRGESVLTKNLTNKMNEGVDRFANGPQAQYNVEVNIDGYDKDKRALAREIIREIKRENARAPQTRTVGSKN